MNENAGALARPPATCPPCHYSKQKVLLAVIFPVCSKYNCSLWLKDTSKITFCNLTTLTFDLWPWPSNSSEMLLRYTPTPNYRPVCQRVQTWECWQTNTQTHRTDFIPSTADAGGKYECIFQMPSGSVVSIRDTTWGLLSWISNPRFSVYGHSLLAAIQLLYQGIPWCH